MDMAAQLQSFHPAVATWFQERFSDGPTEPQQQGWPAIAAGHHTLIAAPTGSGKTLAAFLVAIDKLYRAFDAGQLSESAPAVVYVSPLKALTVDIEHNLQGPLQEIARVAERLGLPAPSLRVAVRNGDTPPSVRAKLQKQLPHLLITTPESLYLMLTAARSREGLRSVRMVIVDEIHALCRDKRGVHLSLSLERLAHVADQPIVRVGLSATQRPLSTVARMLVGCGQGRENGQGQPKCTVVDVGHRRRLDLAIELPDSELGAVASLEQMGEVLDRVAAHVRSRPTTLVFVNTRRMAERVAHLLGERLSDERVAAHHGSLSRERRLRIEQQLRAGELRALVATASLELGIDVGPVELVCQLGSPRSIATFLQRVGRAGHQRYAVPVGRLYPLTRDELVECAALLRAVEQGRLDALHPPQAPVDILAQQLIAECSAQDWQEDALYALVRQAAPYGSLSRAEFDRVVTLVSDGVLTGRGRRGAYLQRDQVQGRLHGRRRARLAALTSGGAIPETADYKVVADPDDTFVGTVNEDFAIESMVGDVFLLGSTSWRIRRVENGVVRVVDAAGAASTIPFWIGEAPARTAELSAEVGELRAEVQRLLSTGEDPTAWVAHACGLTLPVATLIVDYLRTGLKELGQLPTQCDLVFERFFDDSGGMQLVLHAPLGGRINRALGLLLRKRFCTSFDFELQAAADDDALVLSLGVQHSFPLTDLRGYLRESRVLEALRQAVLPTPMFQARFRWNLNRALLVLRFRNGRRNPPPIQRMESDDYLAALFPSLAACQDNAQGPREIPENEPIVDQTLHDCFHEAMDLPGLMVLLGQVAAGEVRLHFRDTTEPSVLSHGILNSRPYTFLDDAPLEERRVRAVQVRRGLPLEARALGQLDAGAVDRVRAEVEPQVRDSDELHDLLLALGVWRPQPALQGLFEALQQVGRAQEVLLPGGRMWCCTELRAGVQQLWPSAVFPAADPAGPTLWSGSEEAFAEHLLQGHLEITGPITAADLAERVGLAQAGVEAALAALELKGAVLRGRFDPRGAAELEQFCVRRLLARIHAYTRNRLRRAIEPVSAQDYMRFALEFQGVVPEARSHGPQGVLAAVAQLQGVEVAIGAWEEGLLRARVRDYRPEWLDSLCLTGEVAWARLGGSRLSQNGGAPSMPRRATPISLMLRADQDWLLAGFQAEPGQHAGELPVVACLRAKGALFFDEIVRHTGLNEAQVEEALWEGVAAGLLVADGFAPLRSLGQRGRATPARAVEPTPYRRIGRRFAPTRPANQGRWAAVQAALPPSALDQDALAEVVAEQLLARWGVVFREVLARECTVVPYRALLWALRRLEARGVIRGGRFVTGFVGEQFALPEAVERLRELRNRPRTGQVVQVSACDPLNLTGVLLPGPRVPAVARQWVSYRDGLAVQGAEVVPSASLE